MSNIRVTYTGFISFFVAIITAITGTVFTLILTRTLTQQEFGTWGLIVGITQYVIMFYAIIAYWSTRDTARKIDSGKTAILGTVFLSVISMIIFVIVSYFLSEQTNSNFDILLFSVVLIPVMFLLFLWSRAVSDTTIYSGKFRLSGCQTSPTSLFPFPKNHPLKIINPAS